MNKFSLPQLNIQNIGILQILLNGCVQTNLLNIVAHPLQEIDGQIDVNAYIKSGNCDSNHQICYVAIFL